MYGGNLFYYSSVSAAPPTLRTQSAIGDMFSYIGTNASNTNVGENGWGGQIANVGMIYTNPGTSRLPTGSNLTLELASLCTGADPLAWATAQGLIVNSLYRLNDPGIWADSGHATVSATITGTALTISTVTLGSSGNIATGDTVSGAGIAGCPKSCPTISSGTYPNFTLSASGGTISTAETMAIGKWKTAAPINASSLTASIGGTGNATLSVSAVSAGLIVPGQYLYASNLAAPVQITAQLAESTAGVFGGAGAYSLSNGANGAVSSETMTTSGIIGGAAIAAGPALVVYDNGPGSIYPLLPGSSYGTIPLSGFFDTSVLGGMPSGIQGQVSATPNGSAISGCQVSCAWSNLSSLAIAPPIAITAASLGGANNQQVTFTTASPHGVSVGQKFMVSPSTNPVGYARTYTALAGTSGASLVAPITGSVGSFVSGTLEGRWSGQMAGVPAGWPYYVSVTPSNLAANTSYANLSGPIGVGAVNGIHGQSQMAIMMGMTTPGLVSSNVSAPLFYEGTSPSGFETGTGIYYGVPLLDAYLPGQVASLNVDPSSIQNSTGSFLSNSQIIFQQSETAALALAGFPANVPTSESNFTRNGTQAEMWLTGYTTQVQQIGTGNGSTTTWCGFATGITAASWSSSSATFTVPNNYFAGGMQIAVTGMTPSGYNRTYTVSSVTANTVVVPLASNPGTASAFGVMYGTSGVQCGQVGSPQAASYSQSGVLPTLMANQAENSLNAAGFGPGGRLGGAPEVQIPLNNGGAATQMLAGSLQIIVGGTLGNGVITGGTVVCQDATYPYPGVTGSSFSCIGSSTPSWVNYKATSASGTIVGSSYAINLGSAPASGQPVFAVWTPTADIEAAGVGTPSNSDWFGNGPASSGLISASMSKTPGGMSVLLEGQCSNDTIFQGGNAPDGYTGNFANFEISLSAQWSYILGTKTQAMFPQVASNIPVVSMGYWRHEDINQATQWQKALDCGQFHWDFGTPSSWTGTMASGTPAKLTLTSAASGPMWTGEVVSGAGVTSGTYITGLDSSSTSGWGASGSVYDLAIGSGSVASVPSATAMHNAAQYSGGGPVAYAGPLIDHAVLQQAGAPLSISGENPHPQTGPFGVDRTVRRGGAVAAGLIAGNSTLAADPTLSRATISACDAAAKASPCFDTGTTYQATFTGQTSGNTLTVSSISLGSRPLVVGQVLTGASITGLPVILSLSVAPDINAEHAGTFTATFSGSSQTVGSETMHGTCSGTSGTGSNCIDYSFAINTGGTYGTSASLATCGLNTIAAGTSTSFGVPYGVCADGGIGQLVRGFWIGTGQAYMTGYGANDYYDDGFSFSTQTNNQNQAFTCNLVSATIVQCVMAAQYSQSTGAFSSVGQWSSGSTYTGYGDAITATARQGQFVGRPGGSPIPFTGWSGIAGATNQTITGSCGTLISATITGTAPSLNIWISGGSIIDAYVKASGQGINASCTFTPATGSGTALTVGQGNGTQSYSLDGTYGIATYDSDSFSQGQLLYDNSGLPGNPLNSIFSLECYQTGGHTTAGTMPPSASNYCEPGMPVAPFGQILGEAVSG
jgi:hypothetical protein